MVELGNFGGKYTKQSNFRDIVGNNYCRTEVHFYINFNSLGTL